MSFFCENPNNVFFTVHFFKSINKKFFLRQQIAYSFNAILQQKENNVIFLSQNETTIFFLKVTKKQKTSFIFFQLLMLLSHFIYFYKNIELLLHNFCSSKCIYIVKIQFKNKFLKEEFFLVVVSSTKVYIDLIIMTRFNLISLHVLH